MGLEITLIILCAALFHATWNGLVKGGKDPLQENMLISAVWIILCIVVIPFVPLPKAESWPIIICSAFLQVGYFLLLAKSYKVGDFGAVYPIVRGLPPLIVALAGIFIINEPMTTYGIIGVLTITFGILSLEIGNKVRSYKVIGFACATALFIATYTIVDSIGARISGNSISFLAWYMLLHGPIFITLTCRARGVNSCIAYTSQHWKKGTVAGILSFVGYGIVLWAVTKAPIAYVSALRETSVLFAAIIAIFFLKEPLKKSRILSVLLIFSGICLIQLG